MVLLCYFEQAFNPLWLPAYPVKINKQHHINALLFYASNEVSKFHTFVLLVCCFCVLKSVHFKEYVITMLQAVGFTCVDLSEIFYELYDQTNGLNERSC